MEEKKMKTAVVGCGSISGIYLHNMIHNFRNLEVTACCARHMESAQKRGEEFGIRACTYEEILKDPQIELVVILTPAPAHYELILQALQAGKHVYTEKTMTLDYKSARELAELASQKGLYLGAAPDTFLGSSLQTAKRAIDQGLIGEVTSFTANANRNLDILAGAHQFLRMPGGGILYDYGVYYLTALVSLLGPVKTVSAAIKNRKPVRINAYEQSPDYGKEFAYPNESQVMAVLELENGVSGTFSLNGDSVAGDLSVFYIYGTKGILKLSDPNQFGGTVELFKGGSQPAEILNYDLPYSENSRGVGVSEMAAAALSRKKNRACKEMACHVLDVMEQMMKSSGTGRTCEVDSSCERPETFTEGETLLEHVKL